MENQMQLTENSESKPKYRLVYDQLVNLLTTQSYKMGDKLPSERDFAAELNVNVLTVRRAFRDLIAADFVTKRVGSGTYLNRPLSDDWNQQAVNLLIDSSCHSAIQRLFEQYGEVTAKKYQREFHIVRTDPGTDVRALIHSYILYHQPTIFCGTLPKYKGFLDDVKKAPSWSAQAAASARCIPPAAAPPATSRRPTCPATGRATAGSRRSSR